LTSKEGNIAIFAIPNSSVMHEFRRLGGTCVCERAPSAMGKNSLHFQIHAHTIQRVSLANNIFEYHLHQKNSSFTLNVQQPLEWGVMVGCVLVRD
jgi:hypothetical protein